MRSVFYLAVLILLCNSFLSKGMNSDSLIEQRNVQLEELRSFQSSLPDSSTTSLLQLIQKMDSVIIEDSKLLSAISEEMALKDTAIVQAENTAAEFEKAKTELAKYEEYKMYAMIGGGVLVLIFLIIIIIQTSTKGKLKKKIKKQDKIVQETEELKAKVIKLEEDLESKSKEHHLVLEKARKDYEQELSKKETEIDNLKKDIEKSGSLADEIKKLKTDLTAKDLKISEQQREIDRQNKTIENAENEIDRLKNELDGVNKNRLTDLEEKEKLINELQAEITRIKKSNNELELEVYQLRNNVPTSNNSEEINKLKDELNRAEKELNESRESLTKEIEALKIENEELRQKLKAEVAAREEKISTSVSEDDIEKLKKELSEERQLRLEMQALMEQLLKRQ